jgi:hypothetical protein
VPEDPCDTECTGCARTPIALRSDGRFVVHVVATVPELRNELRGSVEVLTRPAPESATTIIVGVLHETAPNEYAADFTVSWPRVGPVDVRVRVGGAEEYVGVDVVRAERRVELGLGPFGDSAPGFVPVVARVRCNGMAVRRDTVSFRASAGSFSPEQSGTNEDGVGTTYYRFPEGDAGVPLTVLIQAESGDVRTSCFLYADRLGVAGCTAGADGGWPLPPDGGAVVDADVDARPIDSGADGGPMDSGIDTGTLTP